MKFHDVDTSIFQEEAVERKKEQLILDIAAAFSAFVQRIRWRRPSMSAASQA